MMFPLLRGISLGLSLIVAIGAQNAYVLRQGLKQQYIKVVWLICSVSDVLLIVLGIIGFGELVAKYSELLEIIRWGGAIFLAAYAIRSFRSALIPSNLSKSDDNKVDDVRTVIMTTLALTWLNPHVYLDTVVLLGGIGAQYEGINRLLFGVGASLASLSWFFVLSHGAAYLAPYLRNPTTWRIIDIVIGIIMVAIAVSIVAQI